MALVSLQFETNQILVATARAAGKQTRIQRLFSVSLDQDDQAVAAELKSELAKCGAARSDAIVVVSRASAEMREIQVPPAPDDELPDMVRLIARSEFASLSDNWALDFLPITGDHTQARQVLAVGVSPELQKQVNTITELAGLKLKHMVLRPFSSIELLGSRLTDQKYRLLVDPNGDQTDMTIVAGNKMLATRTVRIPNDYPPDQRCRAMQAEIRRTVAASSKSIGDAKIDEVLLFGIGDHDRALQQSLTEQLDWNVDLIDPLNHVQLSPKFETPDQPSRYGALAGAIKQFVSPEPYAIDFANPRKPVVKKTDYSKWYLYGGLAAAICFMALGFGWWTLNSQAQEITDLERKLGTLKRHNAGEDGFPNVKQLKGDLAVIESWKLNDINWLEKIYQYSEQSLTPDDTIVDFFDAKIGTRNNAKPTIDVRTRIANIQQQGALVSSLGNGSFQVEVNNTSPSSDDPSYADSVNLDIVILQDKEERLKEIDDRAATFLKLKSAPALGKK